jgi:hypothetical protein
VDDICKEGKPQIVGIHSESSSLSLDDDNKKLKSPCFLFLWPTTHSFQSLVESSNVFVSSITSSSLAEQKSTPSALQSVALSLYSRYNAATVELESSKKKVIS